MPRLLASGKRNASLRRSALLLAHSHVCIYLNTLNRLGLVCFRFVGQPVTEPAVVVANHPSLLDFIVLLRDFPNAVCLYKSQTTKNPVLSDFVDIAGYIEGMDGTRDASKRIIDACCQRLDEGHHVVFFPEGTRSPANDMVNRFRTTGFHAAIHSRVAVQPVVIYCQPLFLGKHQPWSSFCHHQNIMTIEYLQPVLAGDLPEAERNAKGLSGAVRERIQERLLQLNHASET